MNMKNDSEVSLFEKGIQRGIENGHISLSGDRGKITYRCSKDYTTGFKNPEEKVRASYFAELVLDYKYPAKRIVFEDPVPRRTPEDRADIVVYDDDELKNSYLVVECKKDGITDAEFEQAIEQVFGNANSLRAKFATVIAGTTRTAFNVADFKPSERDKNVIADIPKKYGKAPKYRFIKGDSVNDIKTVSKEELIRALEKSHDTVWQGGRLAPTTAFDEVSKLLFCKLKDEKDTLKSEPYKFQIGTHETAEDVFKRINGIYQKAKQQDAEVFKEDIRLEPKIVYSVVEHLREIAFAKTDLDTKGVAFETFMTDFFKGKMGQFFTPREIIRFAVEMLNPTKDDLVLDPAVGSGGFLLNSMDNVRKFAEENYDEREAWEHWHDFAQHNLYGIEINDQIARVCKMNMIIHDDGHTNVISTDALQDFKEISDIHKGFKKDHFDIVLTNPPFGATVKETEKDYMDNYELGKNKKTQKSEILFIEKVIDFVKPGTGRIGIVLPDGILTNSSLQYVRDLIMERCQILAVVSLPQFAFSHYGAGVKASLVFLKRKVENKESGNYPIFMAIAEHIGYDATGRKDPQNGLYRIIEEYKKFEKNPKSYEGMEKED
jgi:type I restriction enzyme M protein